MISHQSKVPSLLPLYSPLPFVPTRYYQTDPLLSFSILGRALFRQNFKPCLLYSVKPYIIPGGVMWWLLESS